MKWYNFLKYKLKFYEFFRIVAEEQVVVYYYRAFQISWNSDQNWLRNQWNK